MFLKPIKTYGKEFQAKIYKHYVEITSQVETFMNRQSYTHYAIYRNKESTYKEYGYDLKIMESGNDGYLTYNEIIEASLQSDYKEYKLYVGDIIYIPKLDEYWKVGSAGKAKLDTDTITKISGLTKLTSISKDIELNKYFYRSTFNYIPLDDTNENTTQYIKGAIMKEETRSIKWETDNVPLEPNDIVVIDNKAYLVEDILVNQKVGMNVRKTYTATLLKVGV